MFNRFGALVLAHLLALACTPEIGDECASASECVTTETDRLCLTEQIEGFPGGYCTVFNCAPDSCPEEAVCVGYRTNLANSEQCSDALESSRLQRNYCMRSCGSDSDCRSGYSCLDLDEHNPWGAQVLETGDRVRSKICAQPYSEDNAPERASDVCTWSTPSEPSVELDGGMSSEPVSDAAAPDAAVRSDAAVADAAASDAAASMPAANDAAVLDAAVGTDAAVVDAATDAAVFDAAAVTDAAVTNAAVRDAASDAAVFDAAQR